MPEISEYPSGAPSWADLLSHDGQGAKDFYGSLFGWSHDDHPAGEDMVYTMYSHNGGAVCASAEAGPGQENLPPHWSVYVTVDDLEGAIERAGAAGGSVVFGPCDVLDVGRMAIIQDREGAMLRLWYPLKHAGAGRMSEPGALTWFELVTTDPDSAGEFYAAVLGAAAAPVPEGPYEYTMLNVGDRPVAGIMRIGEDWGPMPPSWQVYFGTADVDATAARAQELGGSLLVGPQDIEGVGRFAVLRDVEGAVFNLVALNEWPA